MTIGLRILKSSISVYFKNFSIVPVVPIVAAITITADIELIINFTIIIATSKVLIYFLNSI
jgi:hypothetical protein